MYSNEQTIIYSEVYGILDMLGQEYINAIPKKMYDFIKENKDVNYNPIYNIEKPLAEQNIKKRTAAFICMLHYKYWCKTDEERAEINKILSDNERKIKEKYSVDNIFKKDRVKENFKTTEQQEVKQEEKIAANKELVKYQEKWYTKFVNFIKRFFIKK